MYRTYQQSRAIIGSCISGHPFGDDPNRFMDLYHFLMWHLSRSNLRSFASFLFIRELEFPTDFFLYLVISITYKHSTLIVKMDSIC